MPDFPGIPELMKMYGDIPSDRLHFYALRHLQHGDLIDSLEFLLVEVVKLRQHLDAASELPAGRTPVDELLSRQLPETHP